MGINHKVASYMKNELNLDSDNEEIIAFSLELLFFTLTNITLVLLVSWLIGSFRESLLVLAVIFILKSFSGGAHCSSAFRCTLLSILLIPSFGKLSKFLGHFANEKSIILFSIFCFLFSLIIVSMLAPVDSPAKPITSVKHKRNLRILSFLFLLFLAAIQFFLIKFKPNNTVSTAIAINISIFWQSLMLSKQGHFIINCYDGFLRDLFRKGGEKDETHSTYSSS